MDYIRTEADGQLTLTQSTEYLVLPSCLYGFHNTETTVVTAKSGRIIYCHRGTLDIPEDERICSCGQRMHINSHPDIYIRHLNIGGNLSGLLFPHNQLRCRECGKTKSQFISFKADGHLITEALHQYVRDLLAAGTYTNKQVAELAGLDKNVIKAIDKKRLQELYTTDDGKKLIKPEKQANTLVSMSSSSITVVGMPHISSTSKPVMCYGSRMARRSRLYTTSSSMSAWNGWTVWKPSPAT